MKEHMKKVFLKTLGWPMGAVLYDYRKVFKWDLVNEGKI
jgi:hypothetical protein